MLSSCHFGHCKTHIYSPNRRPRDSTSVYIWIYAIRLWVHSTWWFLNRKFSMVWLKLSRTCDPFPQFMLTTCTMAIKAELHIWKQLKMLLFSSRTSLDGILSAFTVVLLPTYYLFPWGHLWLFSYSCFVFSLSRILSNRTALTWFRYKKEYFYIVESKWIISSDSWLGNKSCWSVSS